MQDFFISAPRALSLPLPPIKKKEDLNFYGAVKKL
jgi:hypothetical protein